MIDETYLTNLILVAAPTLTSQLGATKLPPLPPSPPEKRAGKIGCLCVFVCLQPTRAIFTKVHAQVVTRRLKTYEFGRK